MNLPQVTVYVMGASLGILWIFKLMMVEDVAMEWNPDFQALKLLQGLVLAIENFLGEVPFFFLSGGATTYDGIIPYSFFFSSCYQTCYHTSSSQVDYYRRV